MTVSNPNGDVAEAEGDPLMLHYVSAASADLVGEWCICNKYADRMGNGVLSISEFKENQKRKYRQIAAMELDAWNEALGWFYWNYQLLRDREEPTDESWKESWDLCRCIKNGWLTKEMLF